jgi:carbonic anhydrase
MSEILNNFLSVNKEYSSNFGSKKDLVIQPSKRVAILTCMDARLDPAKFVGLVEGDAHIIRNAGGRVSDDAVRSLLISFKLLNTNEWFVIHHTDCGMEKFSNDDIDAQFNLAESESINWLTFTDNEKSVLEDVQLLKDHPLVPSEIIIHGFIYNCSTGLLHKVC